MAGAGCKSWGKFWDPGATGFSLSDYVNFSTVNFQSSPYAGNNLWNDYIKNDGSPVSVTMLSTPFVGGTSATGQSTRFTATGTACSAAQTGGYGTCIHAGMIRSFNITGLSSCSGLVVEDSLGAFHWGCYATPAKLTIASMGFKDGKYLSDLIEFSSVKFRSLSVTVTYQGQSVTSTPQIWWSNTVQNLTASSFGVLSGIYLVQSNPNYPTTITPQTDKIALVVKPGITVTKSTAITLLDNNGRNFTWYEGAFDNNHSAGAFPCLSMLSGSFVVVANAGCKYGNTAAAATNFLLGIKNGYLRDTHAAGASVSNQIAFDLQASADANLVTGMRSANGQQALNLQGSNNVLLNVTISNHALATVLGTNGNNMLIDLTEANNNVGAAGAIRVASGANNTFLNLGQANATATGISLDLANVNTQIINFSIYLVSGNVFSGAASTYTYLSGVGKINTGTCANLTGVGWSITCTPTLASDYSLTTGVNAANSYVGKILTDEPLNASDTNGLAAWTTSTDWLNFSGRYRGYGNDGIAFPDATNRSWCNTTCRIWDWSLAAGDTIYRTALAIPTGSDVASHRWSAASQPNCTQLGSQWISSGVCDRPPYPGNATTCPAAGGTLSIAACLTTFLRNAYEILDDGIGNENGLCESNEACIYTPNIASYQGHGNLTCIRGPADLGCTTTFSNGTISNVVLYQYATNGH